MQIQLIALQVYANESDWAPFKNLCGHLQDYCFRTSALYGMIRLGFHWPDSSRFVSFGQELFLGLFDLGVCNLRVFGLGGLIDIGFLSIFRTLLCMDLPQK
jgi:hypothetical protein